MSTLEKLKQQQQFFFEQKKWDELFQILNELINNFPNSEHYCNRGVFLFQFKKYSPALEDFQNALRLSPNCPRIQDQIEKTKGFISPKASISPSQIIEQGISQIEELFEEEEDEPVSFGRYQIIGLLGQGGMGKVYRVYDPNLGREVALKMILVGEEKKPNFIRRFMTEAKAIAQIEHSNVIKIYDIGQEQGTYFFTMEYIKGKSLAEIIKEKTLDYREIANIMRQTCAGVTEAHRNGIIHRDIKPANIMLDEHLVPRVMDFGLAKISDSDARLSQTGAILGTPLYMSPEQARGVKDIDPRTDIYSLGALLYEALTQSPPFVGENSLEILMQVIEKELVLPTKLNSKIPKDLEAICVKCLQKKVSDRYENSETLQMDLQNFLENKPVEAKVAGFFERTIKWCQRYPLITLFLILSSTLAGLALQLYLKEAKVSSLATQQAQELTQQTKQLKVAKEEKEVALVEAREKLVQSYLKSTDYQINIRNFSNAADDILAAQEVLQKEQRELTVIQKKALLIPLKYSIIPNLVSPVEKRTLSSYVQFARLSPNGKWFASMYADPGKKVLRLGLIENHKHAKEINPREQNDSFHLLYEQRDNKAIEYQPDSLLHTNRLCFFENQWLAFKNKEKVYIYDVSKKQEVKQISHNLLSLQDMAFHSSGKYLAFRDVHTIEIHDLSKEKDSLFFHQENLRGYSLAFHPEKNWIAICHYNAIQIWDFEKKESIQKILCKAQDITELSFSSDHQWLVWGDSKGKVVCYDLKNKREFGLQDHPQPIEKIVFLNPEQFLTLADSQITTWNLIYKEKIQTIKREGIVQQVVVLDENSLGLVSLFNGKGIYEKLIMEPLLEKTVSIQSAHQEFISHMQKHFSFSSDNSTMRYPIQISSSGRYLAAAYRFFLYTWDIENKKAIIAENKYKEIVSLRFSPDEKWLFFALGSMTKNRAYLQNLQEKDRVLSLPAEYTEVPYSYSFSPPGEDLFFVRPHFIYHYDLVKQKKRKILPPKKRHQKRDLHLLKFSPDQRWYVISRLKDQRVEVYPSEKEIWKKETFLSAPPVIDRLMSAHKVVWHPSSEKFALLGDYGFTKLRHTVYIFELESQEWKYKKNILCPDWVYDLSFIDNSLAIFLKNRILIHDLKTGIQVETAIGHRIDGDVGTNGRLLALPTAQGKIKIWNYSSKNLTTHLPEKMRPLLPLLLEHHSK